MSTRENEWEKRYQAGTTGWDRGETSNNLNYWLDKGLLKPCRILVPGCGNGYEVLTLAEKGFEVVAIDIAPSAINNLKKALKDKQLTADVTQADFFDWMPDKPFDAIFEQTSLCALPPDLWEKYEALLHRWLKPHGKLYAAFMQTGQEGGPPFHCELTDMKQLFPANRWHWSDEHTSLKKEPGKTERLFELESQ